MLDRALLARYLRQRAELGERELMLEGLSARQAVALVAAGPVTADGGTAGRRDGASGLRDPSPAADDGETAGPRDGALDRRAPSAGRQPPAGFAMIREVLAGGARPESPSRPEVAREVGSSPSRSPAVPQSEAARAAASPGASTLQVLSAEAAQCTACRLATAGRRQTVFGRGNAAAQLVVVGEAPGQEEDRTGLPFVGPAGKLLDLLLLSAGFPRDSVYICNTLKCRPPQNRNPLPDELAACARFLAGQLGAIRPKVLLAVGKFAAQTLVGSEDSITHLRGRVFRYEGVPLVVTYHPAYLLRSPQWTVTAWEDFQLARKVLDEQA